VTAPESPKTLPEILEWHWRRYPLLVAQDIYKLLHQGVFGPGHIVTSAEQARAFLAEEFANISIDQIDDTPDTEPLDPEGRFIRVNLVPIVAEVDTIDRLAAALVESSYYKGSEAVMRERLVQAAEWFRNVMPHLGTELVELADVAAARGYPAIHHSGLYEQAYQPAYRVVLASLWPV
jgi:hypothetical protein